MLDSAIGCPTASLSQAAPRIASRPSFAITLSIKPNSRALITCASNPERAALTTRPTKTSLRNLHGIPPANQKEAIAMKEDRARPSAFLISSPLTPFVW